MYPGELSSHCIDTSSRRAPLRSESAVHESGAGDVGRSSVVTGQDHPSPVLCPVDSADSEQRLSCSDSTNPAGGICNCHRSRTERGLWSTLRSYRQAHPPQRVCARELCQSRRETENECLLQLPSIFPVLFLYHLHSCPFFMLTAHHHACLFHFSIVLCLSFPLFLHQSFLLLLPSPSLSAFRLTSLAFRRPFLREVVRRRIALHGCRGRDGNNRPLDILSRRRITRGPSQQQQLDVMTLKPRWLRRMDIWCSRVFCWAFNMTESAPS